MSEVAKMKINGTTYTIRDDESREKLTTKLEKIQINGTDQAVSSNTVNLTTIPNSSVTALFE